MPNGNHNDMLAMPDDDFLNLTPPGSEDSGEVQVDEVPADKTETETVVDDKVATETEVKTEDNPPSSNVEGNGDNLDTETEPEKEVKDPAKVESEVDSTKVEPTKSAEADPEKEKTEATVVDYEGFYQKIMAPFKANGKTIELRDPSEAVQLMKMGANYTQKMQSIAPHRKVLMMLESNGLLDEGKLSYLIDLDKKHPEAIKKLVKDSGIDPNDIDVDVESTYLEGNHKITDLEANFRTNLEELSSTSEGKETLQLINSQWDQASKEVLWNQPDVMGLIHEQRANGIYDRISTEVNRQRTLGAIPPQVPFLQAYKKVGDELAEAGKFNDLIKSDTSASLVQDTPEPVARRIVAPKPAVTNGDKVSAASPTRSTPRKTEAFVNPLALADDDFMKQMQNRL